MMMQYLDSRFLKVVEKLYYSPKLLMTDESSCSIWRKNIYETNDACSMLFLVWGIFVGFMFLLTLIYMWQM